MKLNIQKLLHFFDNRSLRSGFMAVSLILLVSVSILHLIKPLFDPDFYGHLKTGFWIWDHKALPDFDPFTIKPQLEASRRTQFILSSAWLFQLLLCAFYKIGGFNGIILFRFILAISFVVIIFRFSIRKNLLVVLAAGAGIIPILDSHFPERPQFVSFVFTALILSVIFTRLKERGWSLLSLMVPLCLTMVLWANMHGGFLMGLFLLLYILLAETLKFIHPKLAPLPLCEYKKLAISAVCAILVSLLNPNCINSFVMIFPSVEANDFIYSAILELSSMYEILKNMGGYTPVIAFCTGFLTLVLFFCSRERTNITWIGLLGFLGYMGFSHVRYYPFFLICATLFAIQYFDTKDDGKVARSMLVAFFIAVIATSFINIPKNVQRIFRYGWVPASYFPVKGCDYINANGINGNVFTLMNWGCYVIWRLAPQQKVFFDGRQIDPARAWEYLYNMENWKMIFDKYDIRVVILPLYDSTYKPDRLTKTIEMDPAWRLVNSSNNSAVFVRN